RMGIKPLYYTVVGQRLYFASEIKALLASPEVNTELDPNALFDFLSLLYVPNPGTLFKRIHKLPPGHSLTWKDGSLEIQLYWTLRFGPYHSADERELSAELKRLLHKATRSQLVSDVPVGFFLSGGIDSSTLVACAAESGHSDLKCYSIAFPDDSGRSEQSSDDAVYARQVAKHFGGEFKQIEVRPDVASLLTKAVWHLEDPVADHAAIATYLICELAKPEVTVLLSGQGGDEIFAGYRVHLTPQISRWLRR